MNKWSSKLQSQLLLHAFNCRWDGNLLIDTTLDQTEASMPILVPTTANEWFLKEETHSLFFFFSSFLSYLHSSHQMTDTSCSQSPNFKSSNIAFIYWIFSGLNFKIVLKFRLLLCTLLFVQGVSPLTWVKCSFSVILLGLSFVCSNCYGSIPEALADFQKNPKSCLYSNMFNSSFECALERTVIGALG